MFYVRTPSVTLVGSSPEVMVRVVDGQVTVRPLAGTRRRGKTEEEDRSLAQELLADPKERAEHVMLVDLGRNDVGRVCRYRSVEVSDVMTIERYSHVMHITSNVCGQLAPGKGAFEALQACLPAGTVSGAPKVRAMEIIDELEPHRRGPYAGAVGYVDFSGNMDTCIALRTLVVQGDKGYVQAGAGIVADSVPASEWQETMNKARGLLKAIELAEFGVRYGAPSVAWSLPLWARYTNSTLFPANRIAGKQPGEEKAYLTSGHRIEILGPHRAGPVLDGAAATPFGESARFFGLQT